MFLIWLPVIFFIAGYAVLVGIGASLLLYRIEPFLSIYQYHSGVTLPLLSSHEHSVFLNILLGGPLCLIIGYGIIMSFCKQRNLHLNFRTDLNFSPLIVNLLYYAFFIVALISLYSAGSFSNISSWTSYNSWVNARWSLFNQLSFFEFVNFYMWLPTLAALVLLIKPNSNSTKIIRWLPMLLTIGVDILLYQKKPILLTLIVCFGAIWVHNLLINPKHFTRTLITAFIAAVSAILVYTVIVSVPNLGNSSTTTTRTDNELNLSRFNYAVFSLIARSPGPVLYYPVVFPKQHEFYSFDIGQNMLGFGKMPDDNLVIWQAMYPNQPGGATAPINFVFYSQGGLGVVYIGMFIVGMLIALCWHLTLNSKGGIYLRSLFGISLLVYSMHLSIDSLRNTTSVTYGYIWAGLLMLVLYAARWNLTKNKVPVLQDLINE